MKPCYNQ